MVQKTSNKFLEFNLLHNENGSAIIFALLILITVTIIGITSMNSSLTESSIVRNEKIHKQNFNIAESGYKKEAYYVGHSSKDWYKIIDPEEFDQPLQPTSDADYDPGGDTGNNLAGFVQANDAADDTFWPSANLLNDPIDDKYDYVYLTTYLNPDNPPKGYDADSFSGYKFRMNSKRVVAIEVGGTKVGVKVSGF